jgi:hypothetical protein
VAVQFSFSEGSIKRFEYFLMENASLSSLVHKEAFSQSLPRHADDVCFPKLAYVVENSTRRENCETSSLIE